MRRILVMVGVSPTLSVVEICYVDIRRTVGHSLLSMSRVFPNGSFL